MAKLETPKPAVLKETRAPDDDLESQRQITIPTRRRGVSSIEQPRWFKEFYYRQLFKLARSIAQPILQQSMHARVTRAAPAERAPVFLFGTESRQLAASSSTELPTKEGDSTNPHGRQQIDEYFDKNGEATRSRRSSCVTASSVCSTFVVHDARLDDHNERRRKIEGYLDPLLPPPDASRNRFVLICWGKSNECHIKSVFFQHTSSEDAIWSHIHHAWSESRSLLNSLLQRFRTVKNVEVVTILIAGKRETQGKEKLYKSLPRGHFSPISYIGSIFKDDIASEMSRLQDDMANYVPQEWPCAYNSALGTIQCDFSCITGSFDVPCPEKELYDTERKLLRLKMNPFQRLAFMDPDIATVNSVLDRENTVYSRREVVNRINEWHCPSLGEIPFRAIYIEETWTFGDFTTTLPLVAAVLLLVILVCKFLYGDWGIAWNVGCFCATLAIALVKQPDIAS